MALDLKCIYREYFSESRERSVISSSKSDSSRVGEKWVSEELPDQVAAVQGGELKIPPHPADHAVCPSSSTVSEEARSVPAEQFSCRVRAMLFPLSGAFSQLGRTVCSRVCKESGLSL